MPWFNVHAMNARDLRAVYRLRAPLDTRTRHLFASDCFGAAMSGRAESASAIGPRELHEGQVP